MMILYSDDDSVVDPTFRDDNYSESEESSCEEGNLPDEDPSPAVNHVRSVSPPDEDPVEWVDMVDFEPRFSPSSSRQCKLEQIFQGILVPLIFSLSSFQIAC